MVYHHGFSTNAGLHINFTFKLMTYQKNARYEMGHDWVSEVTRWPGNVRIVNELVQRPEDL